MTEPKNIYLMSREELGAYLQYLNETFRTCEDCDLVVSCERRKHRRRVCAQFEPSL